MENHGKKKEKPNRKKQLQKRFPARKSKKPVDTTPIDENKFSIREMKTTDKYALFRIISEFRKDYYIGVYKLAFRSWFTYFTTGVLLALSLSFINSISGFFPPLIITLFLLWKVNRYKKLNHLLTVNDMEMLNQSESEYFRYKSIDSRRSNQGVILAFLKEKKDIMDIQSLDDLLDSDLDTSTNSDDSDNEEKYKKLVGYLVYNKQKDEMETVCIKEICIDKDYRRRRIATHFLRKVCLNVFRPYGYRRVTFTLSSFHTDLTYICTHRKSHIFKKIYTWIAFRFVPYVVDERSVFSLDIDQIK